MAAGPDRPPLCPVSQRPVAKGRLEPVFPTVWLLRRVEQHHGSEGGTGRSTLSPMGEVTDKAAFLIAASACPVADERLHVRVGNLGFS